MKVTVRLFASARDAGGFETREFELRTTSVSALAASLAQTTPALGRLLPSCRFAVNLEYVGTDAPLRDGDEVAVIPPVSGG